MEGFPTCRFALESPPLPAAAFWEAYVGHYFSISLCGKNWSVAYVIRVLFYGCLGLAALYISVSYFLVDVCTAASGYVLMLRKCLRLRLAFAASTTKRSRYDLSSMTG